PILLPVLYEFPLELQKDEGYWRDQRNWPLLLPNLGRSIDPQRLADDYQNNGKVNKEAETIWVSQHLNIEIGTGLKTDAWAGAGILGGRRGRGTDARSSAGGMRCRR